MRSLTPSENTSTNPEPRSELRRGREGGGACSKGTLYKGVFDYTAKQADELSLQVGLLQLEMELTL